MSWAESDVAHMQAALAEAEKGNDAGEVPVGAVVVFDGEPRWILVLPSFVDTAMTRPA